MFVQGVTWHSCIHMTATGLEISLFFFDLYIKAIFFFFFFLVRIDFGWFYSVSESKYDLYFNVVLKSIVPYCEVDYEWHEYIVYVLNSPYFYFSSWICCCACSVSVETYAFLRPASTPAVLNIFFTCCIFEKTYPARGRIPK